MSPTAFAVAHATARIRLATAAARAARGAWRKVDRDNPVPSWVALLGPVIAAVAGAQLAAGQATEPWLMRLLGQDLGQAASDRLDPLSLAGITGDGTPLVQALQVPMWTVMQLLGQGVPIAQAMASGNALLDLMVRTAVADAGRAADQVGMVTRPAVTSYIRVVESGACSRCIVLAGREYGTSSGFARHPRCLCGMEPVTREHTPKAQDPQRVYDEMSAAQRQAAFGVAGSKAIDDGADIGQVVNARRGMATATVFGRSVQATTEGTTKRGLAAKTVPKNSPRLMPEEIFRQTSDRDHQIRLLRLHGYLF